MKAVDCFETTSSRPRRERDKSRRVSETSRLCATLLPRWGSLVEYKRDERGKVWCGFLWQTFTAAGSMSEAQAEPPLQRCPRADMMGED